MIKIQFSSVVIITMMVILCLSCSNNKQSATYDFNNIPDRIWPGEQFWTIPLEDWKIKGGRVECSSNIQNARFSILPWLLSEVKGDFEISLDMGLSDKGKNDGMSGIAIGVNDEVDNDIRSVVYFGTGLRIGISTEGFAFLGQEINKLPEDFDYNWFKIKVTGKSENESPQIKMAITDREGVVKSELSYTSEKEIAGIFQLVNNMRSSKSEDNGPKFWFDNITIKGTRLTSKPENCFGPVLWTMYTTNGNILKLTAQLPPLGEKDNKEVELQISEGKSWKTISKMNIEEDARTATFRIEKWDPSKEVNYRILHDYINSSGEKEAAEYEGLIRKEPSDKKLRLGALTCQHGTGFPYLPVVKNLELCKPDLLYFSGDQIYEANGGYPIRRSPEETAILSYLGKWYMFGWAFGNILRNTPAICTPDDHDVFHGNLWGEEGAASVERLKIDSSDFADSGDNGGFIQTTRFVNVVNRTTCAHIPDPWDPAPIDDGMSVWYTSFKYGGVSFALVSDRVFKSGPEKVSFWKGRKDHILAPLKDLSVLDKPGLQLLGERQEDFLSKWIYDWKDVYLKVLLSQTLFSNIATHHGTFDGYLNGDMDSGGWPKEPRDRALRIMRKAYVFHIGGDQHAPTISQYGIDDYRDAGWCYITAAISVGYSRWFRPDDVGYPVVDRPSHGLPNTGKYKDAFGNLNYVYAVGNPPDFKRNSNRYQMAQVKSSGFGMILFDTQTRDIKMESWRFLADVQNPGPDDQHPGWPLTINQYDNYGREAKAWLPEVVVTGEPDPVIEVINQKTSETEYIVRIKGNSFVPKVFSDDLFNIRIGYPEKDAWKIIENVKPEAEKGTGKIEVKID